MIPLCKSTGQEVRLRRLLGFVGLHPRFYMHGVFAWLEGVPKLDVLASRTQSNYNANLLQIWVLLILWVYAVLNLYSNIPLRERSSQARMIKFNSDLPVPKQALFQPFPDHIHLLLSTLATQRFFSHEVVWEQVVAKCKKSLAWRLCQQCHFYWHRQKCPNWTIPVFVISVFAWSLPSQVSAANIWHISKLLLLTLCSWQCDRRCACSW